jgi:dipeptidyl aminopeptidase/acylaminoacyl peptidase
VKPTDLSTPRIPSPPTLSPDGRTAVVAFRRADFTVDGYTSQLWRVPTDGSTPTQLTRGWSDSAPTFSPDGRWLAFLRAERTDPAPGADPSTGKVGSPQVWVLPVGGGEARRLTDHPLGADAPLAWSPDSATLAYGARVPEAGRYDGRPDREPPRRITRLNYRTDGVGFTLDRRRQLFTVDVHAEVPEPAQITSGDSDHGGPDWSPDGTLLAFTASLRADRHDNLFTDVHVCRPDGSGSRALTDGGFILEQPRFAPDGSAVYAVGFDTDGAHAVCRNDGIWSVPLDGGPPRRRTDPERYGLAAGDGEIVVTADGVLFLAERRGAVDLHLLPHDDGSGPVAVSTGERQILGAARAGATTVVAVADATSWGEVAVVEADGTLRVRTDHNQGYPSPYVQQEIETTAPDGYPVHGWVVRPDGPGPHPVLLLIHGGPFTQYGWRLFDEAQVYAGAGYAVVMGNPRGSSGYGEAHGRAVVGDVGAVTATDVLALLDAALKADDLDPARVGVMGGSHGGYMATWLAAHHGDRFTAAISERAVNAIDSFTGSSDIGYFFGADLYGPDAERRRLQSPLTHADRIDIPTLIVHSEHDWRCPVEQAQRLYVALKRRQVPVEFLLFPGEGHGLSRSGLPSHRVARYEAILDWWRRWL